MQYRPPSVWPARFGGGGSAAWAACSTAESCTVLVGSDTVGATSKERLLGPPNIAPARGREPAPPTSPSLCRMPCRPPARFTPVRRSGNGVPQPFVRAGPPQHFLGSAAELEMLFLERPVPRGRTGQPLVESTLENKLRQNAGRHPGPGSEIRIEVGVRSTEASLADRRRHWFRTRGRGGRKLYRERQRERYRTVAASVEACPAEASRRFPTVTRRSIDVPDRAPYSRA